MTANEVLQERTTRIESDVVEIKRDLGQVKNEMSEMRKEISEGFAAVREMNAKVDERTKAQDQRINRLSFRFWSMIAGIGLVVVGFILKIIFFPLPWMCGNQESI